MHIVTFRHAYRAPPAEESWHRNHGTHAYTEILYQCTVSVAAGINPTYREHNSSYVAYPANIQHSDSYFDLITRNEIPTQKYQVMSDCNKTLFYFQHSSVMDFPESKNVTFACNWYVPGYTPAGSGHRRTGRPCRLANQDRLRQ